MNQQRPILVTGGAGYIGSHTVWALRDAGRQVAVIDNLSTGDRRFLPQDVDFTEADLADHDLVEKTIKRVGARTIIHFAGSIIVPDSVSDPLGYYANNTVNSHALIRACVEAGVPRFIFSSSAAVYGEPEIVPVPEDAPTNPINPYGASKLMTEWMLRDTSLATGLSYVALRYFDVAGADPKGRTGQSGPNATHLIKIASQVAQGVRPSMCVYGTDYETSDGTCVRDYIHVSDLANAHVKAVEYLERGGESTVLNCGYGRGFSVKQVVAAVEAAHGKSLEAKNGPRRAGDPPALVARADRIRETLGWVPAHEDMGEIVASALAWEEKLAEMASKDVADLS